MHRLVIATRNAHKTREFARARGTAATISDLANRRDFPPVAETGRTFEENAVLKAVAASLLTPNLVLSDDSGLEVAPLNGAPGVYSARYAGEDATDGANVAKLLFELRRIDSEARERRARFVCVLALARAGQILSLFRGTVCGLIAPKPRGESGFGYDPIFVPDGFTQTFAELGNLVKSEISHRAQAIAQLREYLDNRIER